MHSCASQLRPGHCYRNNEAPSSAEVAEEGWFKCLIYICSVYILQYMKTLIVEFDDEIAEKLERVAPGRARQRSEFIRNAVRKALWEIEEQATAEAYRRQPDSEGDAYLNANVWAPRRKTRRTGKWT